MDRKYVEDRIIFETVVGSQAYGISTPESDFDKSGVMIPGAEYFYGLDRFEQFQDFPGEDKTIYGIKKALIGTDTSSGKRAGTKSGRNLKKRLVSIASMPHTWSG